MTDLNEKINAQGLYLKALHYCGRYGASTEKVRMILQRHIARHAKNQSDKARASEFIPAVLERITEEGFINDDTFTAARLHARLNRGDSLAMVKMRLHSQGINRETITNALEKLTEQDPDAEYRALQIYASKRSFTRATNHHEDRQKATQKLRAQGFPFDLITRFFDEKS